MVSSFVSQLWLASGGHPDPLRFDADLALFTLIIFLGLLFVLGKFAWKPMIEGLNNRENRIADLIREAEESHAQAKAHLQQYEDKLASVADEAKAILEEAKQDALATKQRIVSEAQAEAQRTQERALAEIEAAKNAAIRELAQKSVDSAVELASGIVGRSLQESDHKQLVEQAIENFNSGA